MEVNYTPSTDAITFRSAQKAADILGISGQIGVIHAFTSLGGLAYKLHNVPHAWTDAVYFPTRTTEYWRSENTTSHFTVPTRSNSSSSKQPLGASVLPNALGQTLSTSPAMGSDNQRAVQEEETSRWVHTHINTIHEEDL